MTSLYRNMWTFLLSASLRQTFLSLLWGRQLHDGAHVLGQVQKETPRVGSEKSQGGQWKPSASGNLVLELLVLTSMANSKPTKLPASNSIFCPFVFVHTSLWARTAVVPFFLPIHSETSPDPLLYEIALLFLQISLFSSESM